MNDLIAIDPIDQAGSSYEQVAGGDFSGLVQFMPAADEMVKAGQAFAEGDALTGVLSLVGGVTEWVEMAIDPFATLLTSVAGFLMDYMPPLPQALDALAGNPALVEAIGVTWDNVAGALENAAADLMASVNQLLTSWAGAAATAYGAAMASIADGLNKAAYAARCMGEGMRLASGVVQAVRTFVKDLIAELIGQLIAWAGEVAATAGIGASWVIPKATARISTTVGDVSSFSDALFKGVTNYKVVAELLDDKWGLLLQILNAIDEGAGRAEAGA